MILSLRRRLIELVSRTTHCSGMFLSPRRQHTPRKVRFGPHMLVRNRNTNNSSRIYEPVDILRFNLVNSWSFHVIRSRSCATGRASDRIAKQSVKKHNCHFKKDRKFSLLTVEIHEVQTQKSDRVQLCQNFLGTYE